MIGRALDIGDAGDKFMFSATDIANLLACQHIMSLDREEAEGKIRKPFFPDPGLELLRKLGLQHEQAYLHSFAAQPAAEIVEIPADISRPEAVDRTLDALRRGVAVVYQAVFEEEPWSGRPDFLVRVNMPSTLGPWSYEVVETKLARSTKAGAIISCASIRNFFQKSKASSPSLCTLCSAAEDSRRSSQFSHVWTRWTSS